MSLSFITDIQLELNKRLLFYKFESIGIVIWSKNDALDGKCCYTCVVVNVPTIDNS